MSYYPKLEWNDKASLVEKVKAIYNVLNWNSHEMSLGRVKTNKIELQKNIDRANVPMSIAFVKMAEKGEIDEITASEHMEMFLPWSEKETYNMGDLRTYIITYTNEYNAPMVEMKLYKCLQAHTAQTDWTPNNTPSLWKEIVMAKDGILIWSQPISQLDAFMLNDEVVNPDDGKVWVSDYDNNVWMPGVFGWHIKEVAE